MNRGDVVSSIRDSINSSESRIQRTLEDKLYETNELLKAIIVLLGGTVPKIKTPSQQRENYKLE